MFDQDLTSIHFANKAAFQFLVDRNHNALRFGQQSDEVIKQMDSSEMDETNAKDRRLKGNEMSEVYKNVSSMIINRHSYNSQTGVKNKIEVGFIEMIKSMKNRDMCQAKLP